MFALYLLYLVFAHFCVVVDWVQVSLMEFPLSSGSVMFSLSTVVEIDSQDHGGLQIEVWVGVFARLQ